MSFFGSLLSKQPEPEEKRSYPPGWMIPLLEGGKSSTGVSVTVKSALKWTVFYAAVDLISNSVAQLPLHIYRRKADGSRERMTGHPYYRLLHNEPNDQQSAFDFWKVEQVGALTQGNGYAEIERDGSGLAKALWPLPPNKMEVRRTKAGDLLYVQKGDAGQIVAELPAIDVLHGHALGDGFVGMSPVAQFREAIGLGMAAEQYSAAFFANDASPGGILEHPQKVGDEAFKRLRESWSKAHAGVGNARKPAILEQGLTWKQMGIAPEDSQLIESRQFQVVDICRVFHIPPHKLQDLLRATFSNIEHQAIEYVQDCLGPWLVNWEQEINRKLFGTKALSEFYAEFLTEGLLRGDVKTRSLFYRQMFGIGVMTQNEIRQRENLPPIEGGNEPWMPVNMAPVSKHPALKEPEPAPPESESNAIQAAQTAITVAIEVGVARMRDWCERGEQSAKATQLVGRRLEALAQGVAEAIAKGTAAHEALRAATEAMTKQVAEDKAAICASKQATKEEQAQFAAYAAAMKAGLESFAKRAGQLERMFRAAQVKASDIIAAHRKLLMGLCGQIVRREVNAMRKAAKRFETFKATADEFYSAESQHITDKLGAAIAAYAAAMGDGDTSEGYTATLAAQWAEQARARLHDVAERRLPALLDEWEAKRPREMTEKILGDFNHG